MVNVERIWAKWSQRTATLPWRPSVPLVQRSHSAVTVSDRGVGAGGDNGRPKGSTRRISRVWRLRAVGFDDLRRFAPFDDDLNSGRPRVGDRKGFGGLILTRPQNRGNSRSRSIDSVVL
jgi:hypothetical protein